MSRQMVARFLPVLQRTAIDIAEAYGREAAPADAAGAADSGTGTR